MEDVFIEAHAVVRHCIHHTQVKPRVRVVVPPLHAPLCVRAAQVHPPLGRNGHPLGGQSHRRPDAHVALYLGGAAQRRRIIEALDVARSNVSTSLKELQGWGIVRLVHVQGDKRDHFESLKDVWDMFRIVMDERKKREFDPTIRMLRECIAEAERDRATDEYTEARLKELYGFFETTTTVYAQVRRWTPAAIIKFMKAGDKVLKALGLGA